MQNIISKLDYVSKSLLAAKIAAANVPEGTKAHESWTREIDQLKLVEKETLSELSNYFVEGEDFILGFEFYEVTASTGQTFQFTYDDEYAKNVALFNNLPLKKICIKRVDDIARVDVSLYDTSKMAFC
ncbi:MAG: hypothetical protein MJ244_04465 [Clostridia bacterium]|nr:hypothetical protein [Clostridia bacterium]